jgi:pimeloyl-ACP methyl ester carboxylesterase
MSGVGHFRSAAARAHYLDAYRAGMAGLPRVAESLDVPTSFGIVRVHRFDGPTDAMPVVLLPGRGAATPMWRANLPALVGSRAVYCVDLLGEAGLSVQTRPIAGADDQARWLDETLAGLGLTSVHLLGASIGGWAAINHAARLPGRVASLLLLDPVQTFARIPVKALLATAAMLSPGVPAVVRARVLRWLGGGADVDDSVREARLIAAAMVDFVLRLPPPGLIDDGRLRTLDVPVLAVLAGRSVMLDSDRAAAKARKVLPHARIEVWPDASHAINGEFPERVAKRAAALWGTPRS